MSSLTVKKSLLFSHFWHPPGHIAYSPMFIEPEASIIFRGEYQELQNNGLNHKSTNAIVRTRIPFVVLTITLHLHRLCISLLIKFSSKINEQNTTKNKFIEYLCFMIVDFIHSCHHHLKMTNFSWKKKKFWSIDLSCWHSSQPLRLRFLKWIRFLEKNFGPRARAVILKIHHPFKYLAFK